MSSRQSLLIGSMLGFLSVALGAFGAHALKPMLVESGRLETYELATRYMFFHAITILLLGYMARTIENKFLRFATLSMFSGVVVFSGSLYLICITNESKFGMITPVGGILLLAGWSLSGYAFLSRK